MANDNLEPIKATSISHRESRHSTWDACFSRTEAEKARAFHQSLPGYRETRLARLDQLAERLGVGSVWVKDESSRFGLNAFKGLGGSYCIANYIGEQIGIPGDKLRFQELTRSEVREKAGDLTFVTATDGNHGRGIAWTAKQFGYKSLVLMPKGSAKERLENIRALGAEAFITDCNYDDTVRMAAKIAEEHGWPLVQDTAWPGYEKILSWIMQGYMTMALEAMEQLNGEYPTHIFLQAGVGAMAGSLTGFFSDFFGENRPIITIVEPDQADCIYQTAAADDGKLHKVSGDLRTIMAGLACGEPCTIGWEVLRAHADYFVSMPDYAAAKGMRILGNPCGDDPRVISGESGAATLGFVAEIMQNDRQASIRKELKLNKDSRILFFSTEGDTDQKNYRQIVWDGLYPSYEA